MGTIPASISSTGIHRQPMGWRNPKYSSTGTQAKAGIMYRYAAGEKGGGLSKLCPHKANKVPTAIIISTITALCRHVKGGLAAGVSIIDLYYRFHAEPNSLS